MAVRSKKPKTVALVKWLTKKGIEKTQEEHQQDIEKKDAAIALFNDDLQNRKYENVALQAQKDVYQAELQKYQDIITHLETHVPHAKNPGKDNIVIIVQKHATSANDKYVKGILN